jgi:Skp family chaperone for outer membrane proteins
MKIIRAIAAIAFCAAISAATVAAQPKPATTPTPNQTKPAGPVSPGPVSTGSTTGNVPEAKVALLDTDFFLDEKGGIQRLVVAVKKLQAEFQPRRTDIENMKAQVDKMTADLQKVAGIQNQTVTQQQQEAIEQKKREITRKAEDLETESQKRMQVLLGPVYDEIGKALDAFAKAHGITLILDVTKIQGIVSADNSLDITKAFIAEFNSKNPATASLTPQP